MALALVWSVVTLIVTLLCFTVVYFKHAHTYWEKRGVPSIPASFPFGNVRRVMLRKQNIGARMKEIYDKMRAGGHKHGGVYFFSRKVFVPIDPELIKRILSTDFQHFQDRGIYYDEINDPLSAHLFSLGGTKWKNLRAKLTPVFTSGKLKGMFETLLTCGDQLKETIVKTSANENKEPIDVKDLLARFTTDVIGSCAFGIECNSLKNPQAEFRLMGKRAFEQTTTDSLKMILVRGFPWFVRMIKMTMIAKSVSKFFCGAVVDTINHRLTNNVTRNDFLQLLIQLGNFKPGDKINHQPLKEKNDESLSMNEAAAQAFVFFLAGFETSSTTMSFALFELSVNPEIQTHARDEIIRVLKKYDDKFCYDALMEMHYLDQVVCETMRKYPVVQVFLRKCTKRYQIPDTDIFIEEGLSTVIPVLGLHRDPAYFPDPDLFDPDRFNEENKAKRIDYTYLPFGEGPRICIGLRFGMMQTKLGIALLLKDFEFAVNQKTILPLQMDTKGIIITPIGGIWLDAKRIVATH